MKVEKLIELLKQCPPDANVTYYWDGFPRSDVVDVIITSGDVVLSETPEDFDKGYASLLPKQILR